MLMLVTLMLAWSGSTFAQYTWNTYPTYGDYEDMMNQFATDHPDKCELITLGKLSSGRKLMVAHINNGMSEGKPKFLYVGSIHGDETTGWFMMMCLIDYILENPTLPENQNVLENIDLFILPNMNPDGTYFGGNNSVTSARRTNAKGVDLNRNFPDPHEGEHPDGKKYQMETEWIMQFAQDYPFTMAAIYHGGAEVFNYPWDNTYTIHADDAWFELIGREYADLTHEVSRTYMTDLNNGITNGAQWYMIGGGMQDYLTGYAQCRTVTIECSNTKKPSASRLPNYWNYNKNSIFALLNQSLYGIHGTVKDKDTEKPVEATVTINGHDDEYSFVSSHLPAGDFHRPIKGGTYTVTFSAEGYYTYEETVTVADGETVTMDVLLQSDGESTETVISPPAIATGTAVSTTDNAIYMLDGRKLTGQQTRKGIYIKNGRKVVIR